MLIIKTKNICLHNLIVLTPVLVLALTRHMQNRHNMCPFFCYQPQGCASHKRCRSCPFGMRFLADCNWTIYILIGQSGCKKRFKGQTSRSCYCSFAASLMKAKAKNGRQDSSGGSGNDDDNEIGSWSLVQHFINTHPPTHIGHNDNSRVPDNRSPDARGPSLSYYIGATIFVLVVFILIACAFQIYVNARKKAKNSASASAGANGRVKMPKPVPAAPISQIIQSAEKYSFSSSPCISP